VTNRNAACASNFVLIRGNESIVGGGDQEKISIDAERTR
jgi:hypothetical protein